MFLVINILGIFVFLGIGVLFSKRRNEIKWNSIKVLLLVNVLLAGFFIYLPVGRELVITVAGALTWLLEVSYSGISLVFGEWAKPVGSNVNFFMGVLLPLLLVVPLFDILTYFGILPAIIRVLGNLMALITRQPKFEAFYAVEMVILGGIKSLAVSTLQLKRMKADRNLTIAMMTLSGTSAAVLVAYMQMLPPEYVIAAPPLNMISALLITNLLHPVRLSEEEDVVAKLDDGDKEGEPFFSYLSGSIAAAGRMVLVIAATLVAFVGILTLVDKCFMMLHPSFTLEAVLGYVMFPFAWLLGLSSPEAFQMAQYMGLKLVTNEFVVMHQVKDIVEGFTPHMQCVLTVFLTSFANFSAVGVINGIFRGIADDSKRDFIARNTGYIVLAGLLASLMSASIAGLFVW
ncbi:MAG: NupC/NupG family nucleoside CNT transporter [Selenomonadaceae bacterium]|nr:NupC/NupG family nucleoside CNT transporter [Selenomonadaceae bacterium]